MKILTLDIETSPHEGYSFQVWGTNLWPEHIITPTAVLTWSAKWKGDRQSQAVYRQWDDEDFHERLISLLNEADLVVGYNHDKFDLRHINRELVERGYFPTRPVPTVDMLKVVKKRFAFPHYRLDYVAQRILGESKLDTGGFALWPAFMKGDAKAQKLMRRYNIRDVVLTEKLYAKLLPWVTNHPYVGAEDIVIPDYDVVYECPACGSDRTSKERPRRTRCYGIRVVRCESCGSFSDGRRRKLQ